MLAQSKYFSLEMGKITGYLFADGNYPVKRAQKCRRRRRCGQFKEGRAIGGWLWWDGWGSRWGLSPVASFSQWLGSKIKSVREEGEDLGPWAIGIDAPWAHRERDERQWQCVSKSKLKGCCCCYHLSFLLQKWPCKFWRVMTEFIRQRWGYGLRVLKKIVSDSYRPGAAYSGGSYRSVPFFLIEI